MITSSTSLKARIRNKTGGDNTKSEVMLRVYMMERVLERISLSKYKDNFILKGGMLVASLVGIDTRATRDIDTTVRALPLNREDAANFLHEILAMDIGDNVTFQITNTEDIMEGHEYEGLRFFIEGHLDNLRQTIKIDISTGDEITPRAVEYELPLVLENRSIPLLAYNLETLLAEKLETIMTRAEANTRMRDFYDIYLLLRERGNEINDEYLKAAFTATCRRRQSSGSISSIDEILDAVADSNVMRSQWENYVKRNAYVEKITWDQAMQSVRVLKDRAV